MNDCVFCNKLEKGYDEHGRIAWLVGNVACFRPLNPVTVGHLLLVHKEHSNYFGANPEIDMSLAQAVSLLERDYESYNLITSKGKNATQTIPHTHLHFIPRQEDDGLKLPWTDQAVEGLENKETK